MSKVNRAALTVGHAPKAAINSAVIQSLKIGAFNEKYAAAQATNAAESVISTLVDLGFSPEDAAEMQSA
jgi:hypothetical protein